MIARLFGTCQSSDFPLLADSRTAATLPVASPARAWVMFSSLGFLRRECTQRWGDADPILSRRSQRHRNMTLPAGALGCQMPSDPGRLALALGPDLRIPC